MADLPDFTQIALDRIAEGDRETTRRMHEIRDEGGNFAAIPSAITPCVADLLRALGSDDDVEALHAARALRRTLVSAGVDLDVLAAVINPAEPIRVLPVRSMRRTPSVRCRQAEKLTKAAADPYSNLTRWERDFIASIVPALRTDTDLSMKQTATLKRVLPKIRGHRS